jgi:cysteinyl-tRNA synthetase
MFPHHENEIAQSKCAGHDFANVWMHNEMLQVEGKKMSKSLGNFFTVRDLLDQGVPGEVIRFVMLSTHYRKPMDWTEKKRAEAFETLRYWMDISHELRPTPQDIFEPDKTFLDALAEDLNTHQAITLVRAFHHEPQKLLDHARFLGLLGDDVRKVDAARRAQFTEGVGVGSSSDLARWAAKLDTLRNKAKLSKDFAEVDELKHNLVEAGLEVRMSKSGVELHPSADFDPAKLEHLK